MSLKFVLRICLRLGIKTFFYYEHGENFVPFFSYFENQNITPFIQREKFSKLNNIHKRELEINRSLKKINIYVIFKK